MLCKKCMNEPIAKGIRITTCIKCGESEITNVEYSICRKCSEEDLVCQKCGKSIRGTETSQLKKDLETMELNHKYEREMLKSKQRMEIDGLLKKCTHKYDDGSSAKTFRGLPWNGCDVCAICGKVI